MSDLISRSALIELIQKDIEKTASFMNTAEKYDGSFEKLYGQLNTLKNYKSIISDIPTAYDVDKVVAELEERTVFLKNCTKYGNENTEQQEKSYSTMMMYEIADLVDDLIDIVKRGGVE